MIKRLYISLSTLPKWIQVLLIGIIVINMTFGGARQARVFFENESAKAIEPLDSIYFRNIELVKKHSKLSKENTDLMLFKASIVQLNKLHHKKIFMKVYSNHYASVTIFPFLSGITVILSFLIAQNGWKDCGIRLKSIFLIFTLLTGLYGIFHSVYKQKETISKNLENYLKFNSIQNKIFDYSVSFPLLYGDSLKFEEFIDVIQSEEFISEEIFYDIEHKSIDQNILDNLNGKAGS